MTREPRFAKRNEAKLWRKQWMVDEGAEWGLISSDLWSRGGAARQAGCALRGSGREGPVHPGGAEGAPVSSHCWGLRLWRAGEERGELNQCWYPSILVQNEKQIKAYVTPVPNPRRSSLKTWLWGKPMFLMGMLTFQGKSFFALCFGGFAV